MRFSEKGERFNGIRHRTRLLIGDGELVHWRCIFLTFLYDFLNHNKLVCPLCYIYALMCASTFFFSLKKSPLHSTYFSPAAWTSRVVLCDTFPFSLADFHSLTCFLLSCLPLVFFPVCLSPDNSPLSTLFYVTSSHWRLPALPPLLHTPP